MVKKKAWPIKSALNNNKPFKISSTKQIKLNLLSRQINNFFTKGIKKKIELEAIPEGGMLLKLLIRRRIPNAIF